VTLEGASAEGVGRIELHESLLGDDGTMAMQARPNGFVIAAGETITLEPGGKHLMIFDPVGLMIFDPVGIDDLTVSLDFGDETVDVIATFDAEASASAMADAPMSDLNHSDDDVMDDDVMGDATAG